MAQHRLNPHAYSLRPGWLRLGLAAFLIVIWILAVLGVPRLPVAAGIPQAASWLAFLGLLIAPGYCLADLITRRADASHPHGLDNLERLALSLPLGILVLAVPGMFALLLHLTVFQLATFWTLTAGLVLATWLAREVIAVRAARGAGAASASNRLPWSLDELALGLLVVGGFALAVPALGLYKIDGDAYAVASFAADALAGLPLNATEPLFGTDLGPGVRMVFNQTLPMAYLWSLLSGLDPVTLTASASRTMLALWALLAAYTLGKSVDDSRRTGLLVAGIQLLIYLAAPFVRGDNVSLFYFERTNADKFMVPLTMLPLAFAFAIRFVRQQSASSSWTSLQPGSQPSAGSPPSAGSQPSRGARRTAWWVAAMVSLAVSAIHPLIAAMLALGLAGFAGFHLLVGLRHRQSWTNAVALGGLIALTMLLPAVQLVIARGEAPLAPSYPSTLEGWPVGEQQVPILPFVNVTGLDFYGPLPELAELEASDVESDTNPFLMWRFAVNMLRRRLVFFDLDRYISDPNLVLEPPYLLAILLLPLLLWRIRSSPGSQFAIGSTLAVLVVMFNPLLTPLLGDIVMPWILWRFVWLIPYALIIGMVTGRALGAVASAARDASTRHGNTSRAMRGSGVRRTVFGARAPFAVSLYGFLLFGLLAAAGLVLSPAIVRNLQNLRDRTTSPYHYPTPEAIIGRLAELTGEGEPVTVLADQDISVTLPAYVGRASIIAHRMPTTSEVFPADRQDEALQRLIDQDAFFRSAYLTGDSVAVLQRYDVQYVVTSSGSDLDTQLRLSPQWFEWLLDDQSYSLYALRDLPDAELATIRGNSAMARRQWDVAEQFFDDALAQNPDDLLALLGLADVAQAQGQLDVAVERLQLAVANAAELGNEGHSTEGFAATGSSGELPNLHHRLGQLYAQRGQVQASIIEFGRAQAQAPQVSRFHEALADACLTAGDDACAADHYAQAAATRQLPDDDSRLVAEADLWRQRGRVDEAIERYSRAATLRPSVYNQLMLYGALRGAGRYEEAEALLGTVQADHPLSTEILEARADLKASQGEYPDAEALYRDAIWLQELTGQESISTRLALAQVLLDAGSPDALERASAEIDQVLALQPMNATAHGIQGDVLTAMHADELAIKSYQTALELDPGLIDVYVALRGRLRRYGGEPEVLQELLDATIRLNPDEATLYLDRGDQQQRLGNPQAALEAYWKALEALDAFELAARLRPRSAAASRAFVYARMARLYEDLGQIEPAMNFYRSAVATSPEAAWARILLGDALRRRGQTAAAEATYQAVVQPSTSPNSGSSGSWLSLGQDPAIVDGYVRLADLLYTMGRTDEAEQLRRQASTVAQSLLDSANNALSSSFRRTSSQGQAGLLAQALPPDQGTTDGSDGVLKSDETTDTGSGIPGRQSADAVPGGSAAAGSTASLAANVSDAAGVVRALATSLEAQGERERAIELYRQQIALGVEQNWEPVTLARYYDNLGDLLLAQGRLLEAEQAFLEAIAQDSWRPEAHLGLAEVSLARGEVMEGLSHAQHAVSIAPGDVEAQLTLANLHDQLGNDLKALSIYLNTAKAHPGNARATLALARSLHNRSQLQEAAEVYLQTIEMNPNVAGAYVGLSEIYMDQAMYDEAHSLLLQAISLDARDVAAYIGLAELAQRTGADDEAANWYEQAAELAAEEQAENVTLPASLLRYGHYEMALATVEEALLRRYSDPELHVFRARILRSAGRFQEAQDALEEALALDDNYPSAYAELAELHMARGRLPDALAAYREALALAHRDQGNTLLSDYYLAASQLLVAWGQPSDALALLAEGQTAILERGQGGAADLDGIAIARHDLLMLQGRPDEALQVLESVLRTGGMSPELVLALGDHYAALGQREQAEKQYQTARQLFPESAAVHLVLADQALADEQAAGASSGGEALYHYGQAALLAPASAEPFLALARAYESAERDNEAVDAYNRVLIIEPTQVDAYVGLASLYRAQERWDDAWAIYQRGLAVAPLSAPLLSGYATFLVEQTDRADSPDRSDPPAAIGSPDVGALVLLDEAIAQAPTAANLVARATVYGMLERTDDAKADLEAAVAREPGLIEAWLALGDLHLLTRDYSQAQAAYEAVVAAAPGLPIGYTRLGRLANRQGDDQAARKYAEAAQNTTFGAALRPSSLN